MSYSFQVKAATKKEAKAAVVAKFDEIISQQPIHERDRESVIYNANRAVDILSDNPNKDVQVSCHGYLTWSGVGSFEPQSEAEVSGCSIAASAAFVNRE